MKPNSHSTLLWALALWLSSAQAFQINSPCLNAWKSVLTPKTNPEPGTGVGVGAGATPAPPTFIKPNPSDSFVSSTGTKSTDGRSGTEAQAVFLNPSIIGSYLVPGSPVELKLPNGRKVKTNFANVLKLTDKTHYYLFLEHAREALHIVPSTSANIPESYEIKTSRQLPVLPVRTEGTCLAESIVNCATLLQANGIRTKITELLEQIGDEKLSRRLRNLFYEIRTSENDKHPHLTSDEIIQNRKLIDSYLARSQDNPGASGLSREATHFLIRAWMEKYGLHSSSTDNIESMIQAFNNPNKNFGILTFPSGLQYEKKSPITYVDAANRPIHMYGPGGKTTDNQELLPLPTSYQTPGPIPKVLWHAVGVSAAIKIGDRTYFEVLDPNSWLPRYIDLDRLKESAKAFSAMPNGRKHVVMTIVEAHE